jgi:nucleoside 2-deoxyribosyltransferase
MKVHFIGSLRGKKENYEKIIEALEDLGHKVITKHSLEHELDDLSNETQEQSEDYVKKMNKWIKKAEVVVVEVSDPDLGTGYEIGVATKHEKPVIALYTKDKDINVLVGQGRMKERMQVIEYEPDEVQKTLQFALEEAKNQMDVRFNFFVSPQISAYLYWISQHRRVPRSVFLRNLIKDHMKKNEEYEG